MAKTNKKYRKKSAAAKIETETESITEKRKYGQMMKKDRTPEEKREYLKLFLYLIGWIVLLAGIYITCVQLEKSYWERNQIVERLPYTSLVYLILGFVLFCVWLIFNGGFKKIDIDKYEKPDDMGYDEFCQLRDKLKDRQKKSKYYLILFIPFPLIMLIDYIIIVWGDKLTR